MGVYNEQIQWVRNTIYRKQDRINYLRNEICELENISEKSGLVLTNLNTNLNSMFKFLEQKKQSVAGNFAEYYKSNVNSIISNSNVSEAIQEATDNKRAIDKKILYYEEQISQLICEIDSLENDLRYYELNNYEPEASETINE